MSIQSLVLNGDSTGGVHCKNHACCTEWEDDDERDDEAYHGHEGCQGHRGPLSPSIMIPGTVGNVIKFEYIMAYSNTFTVAKTTVACYLSYPPPGLFSVYH